MNIFYNKNKNVYVLGTIEYTKEGFLTYIESDMLQSALLSQPGILEIDSSNPSTIPDEQNRRPNATNTLLYGVPGAGKSWTIDNEYCDLNTKKERIVFHPDYTYSDFVGQILPSVKEDGQINYEFKPGPFTRILKKAYENPEMEYALIIEEINRGNAPAIFGDVFQLLDRIIEQSDDGFQIGTSRYSIINADIAKEVYGDEEKEVRIPSNLSIIGTMNTSDQNVFTLDTAFQRRWNMRLVENSFDNVSLEFRNATILDTGVTWETFCTKINELIIGEDGGITSAEDKRLGVYFVTPQDLQENDEKGNPNRKFAEKVIKYLWDDAFKFDREICFNTEKYNSLEKVIKAFMESKGSQRFEVLKQKNFDKFKYSEDSQA